METEIKIVRKEEYKVSNWTGGTTTELLIYPEDAKYSERNFKWRISSAKIKDEESVFTSLPGIERVIMPVSGALEIIHNNSERIKLDPFQKHFFMGDWATKSLGRVTDFNVMTTKGCVPKVEVLEYDTEVIKIMSKLDEPDGFNNVFVIFYMESGNIELKTQNGIEAVDEGELFYISDKSGKDIKVTLRRKEENKVRIIRTMLYF